MLNVDYSYLVKLRLFLPHILPWSYSGGIRNLSYEGRIDPRLGRLCGLVSSRFALVVSKVTYRFFVKPILSVLCVKISMQLLQY